MVSSATFTIWTKISVGTSLDISTDEFNLYNSVASEQFVKENPGLSSSIGDQAVSYLIAHYATIGNVGNTGIKSGERIGDYSYTLSKTGGYGHTTWLDNYLDIINSGKEHEGILSMSDYSGRRVDTDMDKLKLDSTIGRLYPTLETDV